MKRFQAIINDKFKKSSINILEKKALEEFKKGKMNIRDRSVEKVNTFLSPGKIYSFRYNPIKKDNSSFYDRNPLVFIIEQRKLKSGANIDIGINLNFLPFKSKVRFIDRIYYNLNTYIENNKNLYNNKAKEQKRLPISYEFIKNILGKEGAFALRSYYSKRRSNTYLFSYEKWPDLMFLNVKDIEGANLTQIYKLYNSKIK